MIHTFVHVPKLIVVRGVLQLTVRQKNRNLVCIHLQLTFTFDLWYLPESDQHWIIQVKAGSRGQHTTSKFLEERISMQKASWSKLKYFKVIRKSVLQFIRRKRELNHNHGVTMIYDRWNHSQAPPQKPPHLSYTHYDKVRHVFLTSSPNKRSIRDKTQRIRINRMRLTSPKVHLSRTIHDWLRQFVPCRIVRLFMHLSANAPQWRLRGPLL